MQAALELVLQQLTAVQVRVRGRSPFAQQAAIRH
jgi:hypothetical protein